MRMAALIAAVWVACVAPALAQSPLPDTVRSAGVTQAQWDALQREARAEARRANVSEAALLAAAEAASVRFASSGQFNALTLQQAILETLADRADRIAELQRQLDARMGDADPYVAALSTQARAAIDAGRLDEADRLLAQSTERDLAAMEQADAEVERRRLRAGETIASRGQVAFVQADYLSAAQHYERAAIVAPQSALRARWQYVDWRGRALYERSRLFGEPEPLSQAIAAFETALTLRRRDDASAEWAVTQVNLGLSHQLDGERGAPGALERSVAAYEAALTVITRAADPVGWATAQMNLGNARNVQGQHGLPNALELAVAAYDAALSVLTRESNPAAWARTQANLGTALVSQGQRGTPGALERAVSAYEAALTVMTRETDPAGWAGAQMNLGNALSVLGGRGESGALERAVAAYEAALTVMTRDSYPAGWARTQLNLGVALQRQGVRGEPAALERAVAAYESALTVMTREADPVGWAATQMNLGNALSALGERSAPGALERAVLAYDAALTVLTREANPARWASTKFNLALTYRAMSRTADARVAARGALEAYEQVGDVYWADRARTLLAELPAE